MKRKHSKLIHQPKLIGLKQGMLFPLHLLVFHDLQRKGHFEIFSSVDYFVLRKFWRNALKKMLRISTNNALSMLYPCSIHGVSVGEVWRKYLPKISVVFHCGKPHNGNVVKEQLDPF